MKRRCLHIFFLLGWLTCSFQTNASHIAGGELTYRLLNPLAFQYEITLTLYRDCTNGNIGFDPVIPLFAFDSAGNSLGIFSIFPAFSTPDTLPVDWDACTDFPFQVCIEVGRYVDTFSILPIPGGINLGWARCCRNTATTNIEPDQGISISTHIPTDILNSSPVFNQSPPLFICINKPFHFDHSATDPDGDSLVYQVSAPWTGKNHRGWGAHPNFPSVSSINPMGPPPYEPLAFLPGFHYPDPFGSGNFSIDAHSGFLTMTPTQLGLAVFAVSVFEYRNGVLLSEQKRDFQAMVVNCKPQGTIPVISHDLTTVLQSHGDTVFVTFPDSFCYAVQVQDSALNDTVTVFPVSPQFLGGGTAFLNVLGINPAQAQVCWKPGCEYVGDTVPIIVGGRDLNDCHGINQVFDTVWVVVGSSSRPQLHFQSDTVEIFAGQRLCHSFSASDTLLTDSLSAFLRMGEPGTAVSYQGDNPIVGNLCWQSECHHVGSVYKFVLGTRDIRACRNTHPIAWDSLFVKVIPLPPVQTSNDTTICRNSFARLHAYGVETYIWSPVASLVDHTSPNPKSSPDSTQLFWVEGTDSLGCKSTDSVWVTVLQPDQAEGNPVDSICKYQPVRLNISGGNQYLWSTGETEPSITQYPLSSTSFWVIPFGENECPGDTFTFHVYVEENLPMARIHVAPIEGFYPLEVRFTNESVGATLFSWDFGDNHFSSLKDPYNVYQAPGSYEITLKVDNRFGCPDSTIFSFVEVWDYEIFFPNAFSPNGDGKNDYFQIQSGAIQKIDLSIFNRWGKKIFEATSPHFAWDGTFSGQPVMEGIYIYKIEATTYRGEIIQQFGSITLIR